MTIPEPLRCAIYTTEHNLDLAFNSRDASEKPVKPLSRARPLRAETCCRKHFDDGGLSGASLERSSLQLLITGIMTSSR
jgi:hypothetical protein